MGDIEDASRNDTKKPAAKKGAKAPSKNALKPTKQASSSAAVKAPKGPALAVDHLHPRMIHEIISFVTKKGSISIADIIKIAEPREMQDLNKKDTVKAFKPIDRLDLERDNLYML